MDEHRRTPLFLLTALYGWSRSDVIEDVALLAPETATTLDENGNNLLHAFLKKAANGDEGEKSIRILLRLIPGGALATNNQGQTPYDLLDADDPVFDDARRPLLLARAPSLHPETRQQMNYQARKGALFAFFAGAFRFNIFYRIREAGDGVVLMRQVVSFL